MPPVSTSPAQDAAEAKLRDYLDQLDRAQAEGAARLRQAFVNSPPGIGAHELDAQGILVAVNPEELKLLGYAEKDVVGHPAWKFAVMQSVSQRAVEQKLSGEKELKPFVRTFHRADGTGVALLVMDRLLRDAKGKPTGIRTAIMLAPQTR